MMITTILLTFAGYVALAMTHFMNLNWMPVINEGRYCASKVLDNDRLYERTATSYEASMSAISPPICRLCGKEHGTRESHQFAEPAKIIATYTPPAKKKKAKKKWKRK